MKMNTENTYYTQICLHFNCFSLLYTYASILSCCEFFERSHCVSCRVYASLLEPWPMQAVDGSGQLLGRALEREEAHADWGLFPGEKGGL